MYFISIHISKKNLIKVVFLAILSDIYTVQLLNVRYKKKIYITCDGTTHNTY